jgi:predicted phosphodiesterase
VRTAVFGDVHGNLPALLRFLEATEHQVDAYVCLGDVVNYGPWNDECLEVLHQLPGITILEGNHERIFRGADAVGCESQLVQDFSFHSHRYFSRHDLIENLPRNVRVGPFSCTHTINGLSVYADTVLDIDRSYILGHTHHQYRVERSGFQLVNPGSVGQNRAWIDMVDFLVVDTATGELRFESVAYDIDGFLAELSRRGYPNQCIAYYARKPRHSN